MNSLHPYQRELLEILQNPASPRFGVVSSPPGSGIRRAVEIHLRKVASVSLVLVLCSRRVTVDQWAERLRAHEDTPVTTLTSASAALDLLDGQGGRRSGVLVTTYARSQHGPGRRALSELDFGLIVHDQPPRSFPDEVQRLNSQAQRVIAIVDRPQLGSWAPPWPLLWVMTSERLVHDGYLAPVGVSYEPTSEERALRDEAIGVLQELAARRHAPLVLPSDSTPELHARLLSLASDSPGHVDLSERAWTLLDRMEGSLAADSRLTALDDTLYRAIKAGGRCIVLAATRTDTRYIDDHLANTGRAPRTVLSGATAAADRRSALASLGPAEFLVATHEVCESADGWPAEATVILWPSPFNRHVLEELFLIAERKPGITVLELSEKSQLDAPAV